MVTVRSLQSEVDAMLANAFASLDWAKVKGDYDAADEFVFLPPVLPRELSARLAQEALAPALRRHRSRLPFIRSAGHIGYRDLQRHAPATIAFYRSPAFLDFMTRL